MVKTMVTAYQITGLNRRDKDLHYNSLKLLKEGYFNYNKVDIPLSIIFSSRNLSMINGEKIGKKPFGIVLTRSANINLNTIYVNRHKEFKGQYIDNLCQAIGIVLAEQIMGNLSNTVENKDKYYKTIFIGLAHYITNKMLNIIDSTKASEQMVDEISQLGESKTLSEVSFAVASLLVSNEKIEICNIENSRLRGLIVDLCKKLEVAYKDLISDMELLSIEYEDIVLTLMEIEKSI